MVWKTSPAGGCPKSSPQAKELQKNGGRFLSEKQKRRAKAILFEAGRGYGFSGQGLVDYVDREMAACN